VIDCRRLDRAVETLVAHGVTVKRSRRRVAAVLSIASRRWILPRTSLFAAALAFHALLALAPILLVVLPAATRIFGREETQQSLADAADRFIGPGGDRVVGALENFLAGARPRMAGTVFGVALLLYFVSTFFSRFRAALDAIWEVRPGGLRRALLSRVISFVEAAAAFAGALFVLALGVMRSILRPALVRLGFAGTTVLTGWSRLGTLLLTIAALSLTLRFIPSVRPRPLWGAVLAGALPTAVTLNLATDLFGLFLVRSTLASLYGAAASLVIFLLWVYYSAWVVLFGAEVCRAWQQTGRLQRRSLP
jgi:membrane protein